MRLSDWYFYPRSPCGERRFHKINCQLMVKDFYPRSPCGERHTAIVKNTSYSRFLSTLSLRRATDVLGCVVVLVGISIHALLAESDAGKTDAPAAGAAFLSTLSLRRATKHPRIFSTICTNFYPRSPCGERPCAVGVVIPQQGISIHALLAESDLRCAPICDALTAFLSTLSLRRATIPQIQSIPFVIISIHALLAESDLWQYPGHDPQPISIHALLAESDTQPRHRCPLCAISIHALLAESDRRQADRVQHHRHFYPRSPCGERP